MKLALSIAMIITSVMLVLLVLLHRAKGGGLSTLFGGGVSSSLGGSSVVEKNLDRLTIVVAMLWFTLVVCLGLLLKE
jgi:preprotein translocase subunit SecG